jgi:hypothetical protein
MKLLPLLAFIATSIAAVEPTLPTKMGKVAIPAQGWPLKPGPREIVVHLRYPGAGSMIEGVKAGTGMLANNFNVIAIGVDYLQSGPQASIKDPEPYDFGWLQALDSLRAAFRDQRSSAASHFIAAQ